MNRSPMAVRADVECAALRRCCSRRLRTRPCVGNPILLEHPSQNLDACERDSCLSALFVLDVPATEAVGPDPRRPAPSIRIGADFVREELRAMLHHDPGYELLE